MADSEEQLTRELQRELEQELERPLDDAELRRIKELVRAQIEKELHAKSRAAKEKPQEAEEYFVRFSMNFCLQHLVLAIGVILLTITGLPIKFHDSAWAEFIFRHIWSLEVNRIIHRVGASLLMLVSVWHIGWLMTHAGRRELRELLPRVKDFWDFIAHVKFMLGLSPERPKFGRYSYSEKFEYWALVWGTAVMVISGLMLWFHRIALAYFPKYIFDVALQAHSGEALLAILALVTWHMYHAHFNPDVFPMNMTIFTGKISKKRMMEEHPLEYEQLIALSPPAPLPSEGEGGGVRGVG
ncbi:MAG: cytochrome b/b6 domain-containing protein [Candidatus Bipolaricaulota bacterium]|nr:cytochrome b/b6 domain-containing protein [Candidatus Bipolaricaulota bacterium]